MTTITAGLRDRFLHDSLANAIRDGLAELGWFAPNRRHRPIEFSAEPASWDEPLTFNAIGVSIGTDDLEYRELGSLLATHTRVAIIDLFAESDSLGVDVANDIRDILRGRIATTIPRGSLAILDLQLTFPTPIGYAHISDVATTRNLPLIGTKRIRHWFQIECRLEDTYTASVPESALVSSYPGPSLFPGETFPGQP